MAMKVMVAGDVEGNLTTLFKRVEAVDKKAGKCISPGVLKPAFLAGPFEMLLCVGSFLARATLAGRTIKVEGGFLSLVLLHHNMTPL